MNRDKRWTFEPIRQSLQHGFWQRESQHAEIIISKEVDIKLGLKPNCTVPFKKVELYIDEFIEDFVPKVVDSLYKYVNKLDHIAAYV